LKSFFSNASGDLCLVNDILTVLQLGFAGVNLLKSIDVFMLILCFLGVSFGVMCFLINGWLKTLDFSSPL
jgi:hypothetical protein